MNNNNEAKGMAMEDYFDKDIQAMIEEMEVSEMKALFVELADSRFWIAIMKYNKDRLRIAQNALFTLDPFKDQTSMARYQGIMSGMLDLPEAVIAWKRKSEETKETK